MDRHKDLTQKYSTFGDKLLRHIDVLYRIQKLKKFQPITIQIAPCEVCDSDCHFCSVSNRPLKSYMPWFDIVQCFDDFKVLGAKSIEITGGGNPLLYRDKDAGKDINSIIQLAADYKYDIGIITNSNDLSILDRSLYKFINWIRISLIKLDEGKEPEDYEFNKFPEDKLGFSYIIYEGGDSTPRLHRLAVGTTKKTIERIARLVELHKKVKFVRIAGNCLIKGANQQIKDHWKEIIDMIDSYGKFFIKDIGNDDGPFNSGCYVGAIRPYIAPSPFGSNYQVYICTSHVLNSRNYDLKYSLGSVKDILAIWENMNDTFVRFGFPYQVDCNGGTDWEKTCKYCYYYHNNKLLHTVVNQMPDENFP